MEIIEALATNNKCYQVGAPLRPRGLMLHSIGTPQPSAAMLARYFDQYQPGGQSVCVHAFVQPTGAHDMYHAGEYAIYNAKMYRCTADTAYSPADYAAAWEAES